MTETMSPETQETTMTNPPPPVPVKPAKAAKAAKPSKAAKSAKTAPPAGSSVSAAAAEAAPGPATEAETAWEYALVAHAEREMIEIAPEDILFPPFDARATPGVATVDFEAQIAANGVQAPVLLAPVVHKKTKKRGYAVVAGRRRVRAACAANAAGPNPKTTRIAGLVVAMTWVDALMAAGHENQHRLNMSAWDTALWYQGLLATGASQRDLATRTGKSEALVSGYVGLLKLAPMVQTMVRQGKLDYAKARELIPLKDSEQQVATAQLALERNYSAGDIKEAVAQVKAKADARAAKVAEATKATKGGKKGVVEKEPEKAPEPVKIEALGIKEFRALLDYATSKIAKLRSKDEPDPLKLKYEQGFLAGVETAARIKALPKTLSAEE